HPCRKPPLAWLRGRLRNCAADWVPNSHTLRRRRRSFEVLRATDRILCGRFRRTKVAGSCNTFAIVASRWGGVNPGRPLRGEEFPNDVARPAARLVESPPQVFAEHAEHQHLYPAQDEDHDHQRGPALDRYSIESNDDDNDGVEKTGQTHA